MVERLKSILNLTNLPEWDEISTTSVLLPAGHVIGEQQLLFSKIEDAAIGTQLEKLEQTKTENEI